MLCMLEDLAVIGRPWCLIAVIAASWQSGISRPRKTIGRRMRSRTSKQKLKLFCLLASHTQTMYGVVPQK
jgi:hypothetical protein